MAKPTRPTDPVGRREEDSSPMQPPAVPRRHELPALQALRAPQIPEVSDREALLQVIASSESRIQSALYEQLTAERTEFEAQLRRDLPALIRKETPSTPPHKASKTDATSWVAHLPATLMGLAALVGVIAQSCAQSAKVSEEVLKKIDTMNLALTQHVSVSDTRALDEKDYRAKMYNYQIAERRFVSEIFQQSFRVKIDDPPDAPPRRPLEFYASPHLQSTAPRVQPRETFPLPPAP